MVIGFSTLFVTNISLMEVIFKPESMYCIVAWSFPIRYCFSVAPCESRCTFCLCVFFDFLQLCFYVFLANQFFFLMISLFPYFTPKIVKLPSRSLVGMSSYFFPYVLVEFSFRVLECPLCLYGIILCLYLFYLLSFASTLWIISTSCIVWFNCSTSLFLS